MSETGEHRTRAMTRSGISGQVGYEESLTGYPFRGPPGFHQAVGMVMEYLHSDAVTAFEMLAERAAVTDTSLTCVAVEVIQRRVRFG